VAPAGQPVRPVARRRRAGINKNNSDKKIKIK
jgi:hypothetical protein